MKITRRLIFLVICFLFTLPLFLSGQDKVRRNISEGDKIFEDFGLEEAFTGGKTESEDDSEEGEKEIRIRDGKYVFLNFEDVDVATVLSNVSELVGLNYVMGRDVRGTITVKTSNEIPIDELPHFIESILNVYNLAVVPSGNIMKVLPLAEATRRGVRTSVGFSLEGISKEDDKVVTQIIPLRYITSNEVAQQFRNILSQGGSILEFERVNTIVITDFSTNVDRMLKIINEVDIPMVGATTPQIFVYYLENSSADSLVRVLTELFQDRSSRRPTQRGRQGRAPADTLGLGGTTAAGLTIVADRGTNSLVIRTSKQVFELLKPTIEQLDMMPLQVLIEVMIAEVALDKKKEYGIEYFFNEQKDHMGIGGATGSFRGEFTVDSLGVLAEPPSPTGAIYGIMKPNQAALAVKALASVADVNILSTPTILTANNREAKILVGQEVPFESSRRTLEGGVIDVTVEFRDVGIELNIKPHINNERFVSLWVKQKVNDLTQTVIFSANVVTKREVETSVVCKDGESVIIGGLMSQGKTVSEVGIPILKDIPLLGYLFKSQTTNILKRELILILTPHVVASTQEIRDVTEKQTNKMELFKEFKEELDAGLGEAEEEIEEPSAEPVSEVPTTE
jgi:general secretion pathway protein D